MNGTGTPRAAAVYLRTVERSLVVLGLVLLGCYAALHLWSAWYQAASMRELEQMRASFSAARAGRADIPGRASPAPGSIVGRIELGRLGISAIVREGDDPRTLRGAVGHVSDTALPGERGNAALAGHRDTFFRPLQRVRSGDRIVVTTPAAVFHYVVSDLRVVDPTDTSVLAPTPRSTLTLVTCYPFSYIGTAPKRFIVRAELVSQP
jgi:sortase A